MTHYLYNKGQENYCSYYLANDISVTENSNKDIKILNKYLSKFFDKGFEGDKSIFWNRGGKIKKRHYNISMQIYFGPS